MTAAVLVDTSVWIDHLRDRPGAAVAELAGWLSEDADRILINEIVTTELLRGVRSDRDATQLQGALDKLAQADPIRREDWLLSARVYRDCRAAGLTVRSPMDCLMAAHALRLQVAVLAVDRDFDAIASCTPLRLHGLAAVRKPRTRPA